MKNFHVIDVILVVVCQQEHPWSLCKIGKQRWWKDYWLLQSEHFSVFVHLMLLDDLQYTRLDIAYVITRLK